MHSVVQQTGDEDFPSLCRRLIASDRRAFERLFRALYNELVRYTETIAPLGPIAHDLVQDVFVDLWNRRERLDADLSLKSYLYRMARNRTLRHLRDERSHAEKHRQIRRERQAAPPNGVGAAARIDADTLTRKLDQWIEELPERQREALVLSRFHALSHQEIAAVMEISPRTVNNHIMRALHHLRARIQDFEPQLLDR